MQTIQNLLLVLLVVLVFSSSAYPSNDCEQAQNLVKQGVKQRNITKRLAILLKAKTLCPEADAPHFYYGLALEAREDAKKKGSNYRASEQEYRQVLQINPKHYPALYKLAGIEYITGQFDSAAVHFSSYLALDLPNDENQETRTAANNLMVKCCWLARLPKGSIKPAALTHDPDRVTGVPRLIGDIAFELGRSAAQVTGNLGYGLVGAGLKLGLALLSSTKDAAYNKIGKAYKQGDYATAYTKAFEKLPDAVNNYGINAELVSHLLRIISVSGSNFTRLPIKQKQASPSNHEADLSKAEPALKLIDLEPFLFGALLNSKTLLTPSKLDKGKEEHFALFWEFATIIRDIAHVQVELKDYRNALRFYHLGLEHIENYGGVFVSGQRIASPEDIDLLGAEYALQIHIANVNSCMDSTHAEALQKILDIRYAVQNHPELKFHENLNTLILSSIISWVNFDCKDDFKPYRSLFNLRQLTLFIEEYTSQNPGSPVINKLTECLFKSRVAWGENGLASLLLEKFDHGNVPNELSLSFARHYITLGLPDSAAVYLAHSWPTSRSRQVYFERLHAVRMYIFQNQMESAIRVLMAAKQMEESDSTLAPCASSLWWLAAGPKPDQMAALEQMRLCWQKSAATSDWKMFKQSANVLLHSMVFSESFNLKKKQLFDQLLAVAMSDPRCSKEDLNEFRLNYCITTQQWSRALELALSVAASPQNSAENGPTMVGFIFDQKLTQLAFLHQKTGDFNKAVEIRQFLLDRLLPYASIIPENTAAQKIMLAESLVAFGQKKEAITHLEEAMATYRQLWTSEADSHHILLLKAMIKNLQEGKKVVWLPLNNH